jgi:hypothetical protein
MTTLYIRPRNVLSCRESRYSRLKCQRVCRICRGLSRRVRHIGGLLCGESPDCARRSRWGSPAGTASGGRRADGDVHHGLQTAPPVSGVPVAAEPLPADRARVGGREARSWRNARWQTPYIYSSPRLDRDAGVRFCRISVVILVVAPIMDHGGACHRREPQPGRIGRRDGDRPVSISGGCRRRGR